MSQIRKAVIPAAGCGTRMFPATYAIPKEMLPVAGKPLIQYAIEEAAESGIEEVVLVLSQGKETIIEHCRALRSSISFDPAHSAKLPTIQVAWQQAPRGLADAILTARGFIGEESFAVILPDVLIDSKTPCTAQLAECCDANARCVIAMRDVDSDKTDRFGILELSEEETHSQQTFRIKSLIEKPGPDMAPSTYGIYGRYILPVEIFDCIEEIQPGFGEERQLTDALNLLANKIPAFGFLFEGTHYDAGNHPEFLEASVVYALKNPAAYPDLSNRLEEFLRQHNPQPALSRLAS
ncbi:MAG TPA: sugar phosphate nucleotidyltransferase [Terriglobales bacterium]|jgi:UTP--glucose-1-phosphate uridylyltransferase